MISDKIKETRREYLSGAAFDIKNLSPKQKFLLHGKLRKTPIFTQRTLDAMIALSFCGGFIALGVAVGLSMK